jgi:hypothetical protein
MASARPCEGLASSAISALFPCARTSLALVGCGLRGTMNDGTWRVRDRILSRPAFNLGVVDEIRPRFLKTFWEIMKIYRFSWKVSEAVCYVRA